MTTLVIHPNDSTTDFLKPIYENKGFTVLTKPLTKMAMERTMRAHDRIIMLGHGTHFGLITDTSIDFKIVVGHENAHILREKKELIGIWCNADRFFAFHGLKGFHTGMFVSEDQEAKIFIDVNYTIPQIDESNDLFVQLVGKHIDNPLLLNEVKNDYRSINIPNPIIEYNKERLYK